MWKRANRQSGGASDNWNIYDAKRGLTQPSPQNNPSLIPDTNSEEKYNFRVYATDNGFAHSETFGTAPGNFSDTFIYVAIAENTTFFDVNNEEATQYSDLEKRFGIDPTEANLKQLGIAELTEQPTGPVLAYVPKGDEYIPVPDQSAKIASLTSSLSEARSRLASIEADEVNDDAVSNSLITLLGNLNARISNLEGNN